MLAEFDLHKAMNLRPGELPFMKPLTPAEMRIGLSKASRYNEVVRRVNNMAEAAGWTGEDKYTALAFYATLQLETMQGNYLRSMELRTSPPMMVVNADALKCPEKGGK